MTVPSRDLRITVAAETHLLDSQGDTVGRLQPGFAYPILQEQQGWYETRDGSGASGWVLATSVTITGSAAAADAGASLLAYVDTPVEVWSLHETSTIAGHLQPGVGYRVRKQAQGWLHVDDGRSLEGWVGREQVRLRERTIRPPTVSAEARPSTPDHVAPAGGLPAWASPDPGVPPVATIAAGTPLGIVARRGDWTQVRATNGWEGWVDGRRLVAQPSTQSGAAPREPAPAVPPPQDAGSRIRVALGERPLPVGAGVVLVISAFVSWIGGYVGTADAFDIPLSFLYSLDANSTTLNFGILMLVLAAGALLVAVIDQNDRSAGLLRTIGGIALGAGVIFLVQLARSLAQFAGWGTLIPDLFFRGFAIGPYLAMAAGIILLWLPHRITVAE